MILAQKLLFPGKQNTTPEQDKSQRQHIAHMRDLIFYVALLTEIALVIIDKSSITNTYVSYFFRFTFVLTVAVVLLSDLNKKEWIFLGALLLLGFICYRISGRNEFLRFTMFAAACHDINYRKALKTSFFAMLIGSAILIILAFTGILGTVSLTMDYGRENGVETRYVLGFGHPNSLQAMYFAMLLLGMYLYHEKMKWYTYLLLLIASFGIYSLTDSRTGLLLSIFAIFLFAIADIQWIKQKKISYIATALIMLASVIFSYWAAKNSYLCWREWELVDKVDKALNGRIVELYWGTNAHEGALETWRLFSTRDAQAYFDMGIVRLFYWYGWIPASALLILLLVFLYICYQKRDFGAAAVVASMSVYSIIEAHFVSTYIGRNFLIILLGAYLPLLIHHIERDHS